MDKRILWGAGLAAVAVVVMGVSVAGAGWNAAAGGGYAADGYGGESGPAGYMAAGGPQAGYAGGPAGEADGPAYGDQAAGAPQSGGAQQAMQALNGLAQIRQQQCQNGIGPACQQLQRMPGYQQQLVQFDQGCRRGDRQACGQLQDLSQRIFTDYQQSAAVVQAGRDGMARMDAWRAQMNRNADASMANLQAQGARGQAAHQARQDSYAAMNQGYAARDAAGDRNQGRYVDGIYGGTTYDGGGVQGRVDYGSTGYTDGNGNMVAVPNGMNAPDGYSQMNETYASPD